MHARCQEIETVCSGIEPGSLGDLQNEEYQRLTRSENLYGFREILSAVETPRVDETHHGKRSHNVRSS